MDEQETSCRKQLTELAEQIAQLPDLADSRYPALAKQQKQLQELVELYDRRARANQQLTEAQQLAANDGDLGQLAAEEIDSLQAKLIDLNQQISQRLQSADPEDEKNVIVEIRAGVGGDEASLFAADLYRMYSRYSDKQGWRIEILSQNPSEAGGFKEIIFAVRGQRIFGCFKFESGVHRVQRVPATESQGRIHTSTASVAVMVETDETELVIDPANLRIDTFRSSGCGGQSVNTTDSAVRITHLPTGLTVSCQDEKSQLRNRQRALSVLRARLNQLQESAAAEAASQARSAQIGRGGREEKVRTYNFPQNRLTDHRLSGFSANFRAVIDGQLDELHQALAADQSRS